MMTLNGPLESVTISSINKGLSFHSSIIEEIMKKIIFFSVFWEDGYNFLRCIQLSYLQEICCMKFIIIIN